ncbi:hypothetical protein D3C80_1232660 [compost metagenome]
MFPAASFFGRETNTAIPDGICIHSGLAQHEWFGFAPLTRRDACHVAAGGDRCFFSIEDRSTISAGDMIVAMLDQQPVDTFAVIAILLHADQHEAAF